MCTLNPNPSLFTQAQTLPPPQPCSMGTLSVGPAAAAAAAGAAAANPAPYGSAARLAPEPVRRLWECSNEPAGAMQAAGAGPAKSRTTGGLSVSTQVSGPHGAAETCVFGHAVQAICRQVTMHGSFQAASSLSGCTCGLSWAFACRRTSAAALAARERARPWRHRLPSGAQQLQLNFISHRVGEEADACCAV